MGLKVAFMSDEAIERDAEALLADYAREREVPIEAPIPIEDIIEKHLKIGVEFDDTHRLFGVPRSGIGFDPDAPDHPQPRRAREIGAARPERRTGVGPAETDSEGKGAAGQVGGDQDVQSYPPAYRNTVPDPFELAMVAAWRDRRVESAQRSLDANAAACPTLSSLRPSRR
ncbi:MAG: hypothetical protein LCH61_10685 [Proteobacteria bacterium]|nr:hypothetical protein [Pseudomonadota bacterium]